MTATIDESLLLDNLPRILEGLVIDITSATSRLGFNLLMTGPYNKIKSDLRKDIEYFLRISDYLPNPSDKMREKIDTIRKIYETIS